MFCQLRFASCYLFEILVNKTTMTMLMFYVVVKKPEFTDKKVMAGKEYEYRVTAENAGGESEPSEVSSPIKAKPLKGH